MEDVKTHRLDEILDSSIPLPGHCGCLGIYKVLCRANVSSMISSAEHETQTSYEIRRKCPVYYEYPVVIWTFPVCSNASTHRLPSSRRAAA